MVLPGYVAEAEVWIGYTGASKQKPQSYPSWHIWVMPSETSLSGFLLSLLYR